MSDQINNSLSDIPVDRRYDVIVVGAGHAGCEAALAAARMGRRTLLLTMNLDSVALMPCNPSIGGPAKGHLVREIDALGGEMGRATDRTFIQIRMLNTGKGPAVQALRAQCDKQAYRLTMKYALERQPNLDLKQARSSRLLVERDADGRQRVTACRIASRGRVLGARGDPHHRHVRSPGALVVGDRTRRAGARARRRRWALGRPARARLPPGRLKTGTPPRIDARTDRFRADRAAARQPDAALFLASTPLHARCADSARRAASGLSAARRGADAWRPQLPCYLVHTNERDARAHPRQPRPRADVQRRHRGRRPALLPLHRGQGRALRREGAPPGLSWSRRAGARARSTCRARTPACPKTCSWRCCAASRRWSASR